MVTGRVTYEFGWREWQGRNHDGIDLAGRYREPILAAATGFIRENRWCDGLGWMIVIRHNINGRIYDTLYGHLRYQPDPINNFRVGATIQQGQVIGIEGNTGQSGGDHLHFEIHPGGKHPTIWGENAVNPRRYIIFPDIFVWW